MDKTLIQEIDQITCFLWGLAWILTSLSNAKNTPFLGHGPEVPYQLDYPGSDNLSILSRSPK